MILAGAGCGIGCAMVLVLLWTCVILNLLFPRQDIPPGAWFIVTLIIFSLFWFLVLNTEDDDD
jgi:hypothetical protein